MIKFENVSFSYESEKYEVGVKNINLEIDKGELVVVCGKSGCGKTTITRLINGLIPNYYEGRLSGKIIIEGIDMVGADIYDYTGKVGSVFQNPRSQFYNVNTNDELAFGCENIGINRQEIYKRIGRAISEFKILELMERSLFELSGGEKQKIACASVSTMQPDIYVLDEPSSNLDIAAIKELKKVVNSWKKEGKTIVIAEHRLYWLTQLADKFVYMNNGKIENIFSKEDFMLLSDEKRQDMGLRSTNPFNNTYYSKYEGENSSFEIKNLKFTYKKQQRLKIDNLVLPKNSIIGVLGDNGAGKTTFAKCLCGLEKKAKGTINFNGVDVNYKKLTNKCFMVMQDVNHQLFTESVLDEVLLSMNEDNEEENIKKAENILKKLNLLNKVGFHPMSLSGGEKQRVAIASAIASEKDIIILDEPTSGLDYNNMKEVANQINNLKVNGKTIFLITHDPELLYLCCTHIMFEKKGEVSWVEKLSPNCIEKINTFFKQ